MKTVTSLEDHFNQFITTTLTALSDEDNIDLRDAFFAGSMLPIFHYMNNGDFTVTNENMDTFVGELGEFLDSKVAT